MLTNILIAVGMSCALGTAFNNANANNFINNDTPNNVVYYDEDYQITLNANELNNYTWDNFISLFNDNESSPSNVESVIEYNSLELNFEPSTLQYDSDIQWVNDLDTYYRISLNETTKKFVYTVVQTDSDFEYSIIIKFTGSSSIKENRYNLYKTAIELDIVANTNTTPSTQDFVSILGDMIGLITGGLTGFATGIGSGIQTLVSSLFIASNGTSLSLFGAVICIFGGIAFAIGLSRLIFQWIASIGAKH